MVKSLLSYVIYSTFCKYGDLNFLYFVEVFLSTNTVRVIVSSNEIELQGNSQLMKAQDEVF